jgi:hypothetical protein
MKPFIYISSSWKQRERVRTVAEKLRERGFDVYDFTDPKSRAAFMKVYVDGNRLVTSSEIPPENFPEQFDPERHDYEAYLSRPAWRDAMDCNRRALNHCDAVVLLLPCGNDAHADWAYAVGQGKFTVVAGHPPAGERSPTHLWANFIVEDDRAAIATLVEEFTSE